MNDVYDSTPSGYPFNTTGIVYYTIRVREELKVSRKFRSLQRYSPNRRPHGFPASTGSIPVEWKIVHRPWTGDQCKMQNNPIGPLTQTGLTKSCPMCSWGGGAGYCDQLNGGGGF